MRIKPQTEKAFLAQVLALADLRGWMVYHARPARTVRGWVTPLQGDAGFPDLVAVRDRRVIVAELKVGRNKVSLMQALWLAAFEQAGIPAYCWHPDDWKMIEAVLE